MTSLFENSQVDANVKSLWIDGQTTGDQKNSLELSAKVS